jgi:hypothetical protein
MTKAKNELKTSEISPCFSPNGQENALPLKPFGDKAINVGMWHGKSIHEGHKGK